ncbi:carboxylating nicotinate-nucleotide diphosphorylase [Myxococcota bacterium]|nr:carboxylating nicotinate-nucleotide diphosphorylase [Myxococcota bacterium]
MALDAHSKELIRLALAEDLGPGDVTSLLIPEDQVGAATVLARTSLVLAGTDAFTEVFRQVDPQVSVLFSARDGDEIPAGTTVGTVRGRARSLLAGERTALNLLQRLCGVASAARAAVKAVEGTKSKIVDTRKTTPGLRYLEKAAVRAGGATNHRIGLFDGVLIKDNHVRAAGGVRRAIEASRRVVHHLLKIECEVTTLDEVQEALDAGAEIILLDNMSNELMAKAVELVNGRALLEASGGVRQERLRSIAETGVDLISMGALTHSAPAADIALEWT